MKSILIVVAYLYSFESYGQSDSVRVRETVFPVVPPVNVDHDSTIYNLQMGDRVACDFVGARPIAVKNFNSFILYASKYPSDSLRYYLDKKFNLALRIYSVWGLLLQRYDSVEYLIDDLLKSNDIIFYNCGCIAGQEFTVKQFLYLLFSGKIDLSIKHVQGRVLRYINKKYSPGTSKVMQSCKTNLIKLKAF